MSTLSSIPRSIGSVYCIFEVSAVQAQQIVKVHIKLCSPKRSSFGTFALRSPWRQ